MTSKIPTKPRNMPPLHLAIPAVVGAWAIAFEIPHLIGMIAHEPAASDFRLFYVAAEAGLKWGWPHLYDPAQQQELSLTFSPGGPAISPAYTYQNPPLLAWLIAPLTLVALPAAFFAWTAFNVTALVAAWRLASPGTGFARATVLLVTLALWPTVFSLERGQAVLVTYALAVGCWWLAARRHEVFAGLLLGLASAIRPQDVALLPVVLLLCGFWRSAVYWLATTVTLWAAFALVIGPNGVGTYLAVLAWAASDPSYTGTPVFAPFGARTSLILGQAGIAGVALAAVWRQRRTFNVAFAIGLLGTAMSAIHVHEYDYVGLIVAAWLALAEPTSALEFVWMAIGVVCMQLPLIGMRLPILIWQPVWLLMLTLRRRRPVLAAPKPSRLLQPIKQIGP
jgi:hypothetical protein